MLAYLYILLCSSLMLFCLVSLVRERRRQRMATDPRLEGYVASIIRAELDGEKFFVVAGSAAERELLLEAIYLVVSHTYGIPLSSFRELVRANRLDEFLMRRIAWSRGADRARWLLLSSVIPLREEHIARLKGYLHSGDSIVRSSTLLALLSLQPSRALQTIVSLNYHLSPFDVVRIITLLRRGVMPIAYEPLLKSANRNVQMVGLAIVRSFGIDIAEKHLHAIISTTDDAALAREVIYTLSSLGRPLGREKVKTCLCGMTQAERRDLCRYLSVEGYSMAALRTLFTEQEIGLNESLIKSYKRDLICPQANF